MLERFVPKNCSSSASPEPPGGRSAIRIGRHGRPGDLRPGQRADLGERATQRQLGGVGVETPGQRGRRARDRLGRVDRRPERPRAADLVQRILRHQSLRCWISSVRRHYPSSVWFCGRRSSTMSGTESSIVAARRVAVVGAGAAGISAAFWLRRAGAHVQVLEAGEQVGGRCRTVERDGFRFDISAGALPSTYADLLRLLDALGVRHEIELRGAVIGALRDGAVHRIARRNPLSFLSARHIPAKDKASLWRLGLDLGRMFRSINYRDLGTAARFDVETMHDYCTRHYPDSVRDNLLEPITRALLLVEPEQSSVVDLFAACRSLLLAGHILTHPEGVGFFLQRAAQHLDVSLGAVVDRVDETEDGVEVHWSDARGTQLERFDAAVL